VTGQASPGPIRRGVLYTLVSVVNVPLSQIAIVALQLLGLSGWLANLLAVLLLTGPAYAVTRHVVWRGHGSDARAAASFWTLSLAGLFISTFLVYLANRVDQRIWVANLVNLATYGGIFVMRFVVLDRLLTPGERPDR
jgi:hypothetical protein